MTRTTTRTVVVGAGSAGCVVASRLTERDDHEVVLLESGPDLAPGDVPEAIAGPDGRPAGFSQTGWQVDITRFGLTAGGVLPTRLTLTRDNARLRLAVGRWELPP